MGIDKEYIAGSLKDAPKEMLAEIVGKLAEFYGVSRQTIWRKANEAGFRIRSERTDKGKTAIDDGTLDVIAARVNISKRLTKQFTNSVKKAVKDLEQKVEIPVGYQRVCTMLRSKNLDKESLSTPTPHVRLMSLHPNHVHQFDVTNCLQWHFKNKGGLDERDVERMFYKNKVVKEAKKIKLELLRYVIVDHCSGAFFFKYYYTSGERAEDGADFFYDAWRKKDEIIEKSLGVADYRGIYQFQGVPKMLVADKGSILKHKAIVNLMDGLGVQIETHQAGNPRAKGMVEGLMRIIGYDFESDLKIYNIQSLEDLNRFALDWCIERNAGNTFRRSLSRARLWLKIKREELRLCPDKIIFTKLQHRGEEKRKCDGNGVISFENRYYKCPDVNAAHKWVVVKINAYEYPKADIHFNGYVYAVEPLGTDEYGRIETPDAVIYGEYRAPKLTEVQKAKTRLEEVAHREWGVSYKGHKDKRMAVPPALSAMPARLIKEDDNMVFIQAEGVQIQTPDVHKPLTKEVVIPMDKPFHPIAKMRLVPVSEIIRRYVSEIGKLTIEQNRRIKAEYPTGVPETVTMTDIYNFLFETGDTIAHKKQA